MSWTIHLPEIVTPTSERHTRQLVFKVTDTELDEPMKITVGLFWTNERVLPEWMRDEGQRHTSMAYFRLKVSGNGGSDVYTRWYPGGTEANGLWYNMKNKIAAHARQHYTPGMSSMSSYMIYDYLCGYNTGVASVDEANPWNPEHSFAGVPHPEDFLGYGLCPECEQRLCAYHFIGRPHPTCQYFENHPGEPVLGEECSFTPGSNTFRLHSSDDIYLCSIHTEEMNTCSDCGWWMYRVELEEGIPDGIRGLFDEPPAESRSRDGMRLCPSCVANIEWRVQDGEFTCNSCDAISMYVDTNSRGYCRSCDLNRPEWRVQAYSFKPQPIFHPEIPDDPRTLYHGFEFEIANLPHRAAIKWAEEQHLTGDLIYLKADSSVSHGTEVVTHPFTHEWAKANFPFDAFQAAVDRYGASETHPSAGTHIHVNKASFSAPHMWKFLQLHFRLPAFLQILGGRASTNYASWSHETLRENTVKIAKKKGYNSYGRLAVNVDPEYTIELRYPASGASKKLVGKNIDLPNALWQFSAEISVKNIKDGILDNPGYLQWWIDQEKGQFPALHEYMTEVTPTPTAFERSN